MKDKINSIIKKMIIESNIQLDKEHVREDLFGQYSEIVSELSIKAPGQEYRIYEYASVMEEEQKMFSPYQAFEAGFIFGNANLDNDLDREEVFIKYFLTIYMYEYNIKLLHIRDKMFYELCDLLGETSGLMHEYNDLYRRCYGIIGNNLNLFFDLGFDAAHSFKIKEG